MSVIHRSDHFGIEMIYIWLSLLYHSDHESIAMKTNEKFNFRAEFFKAVVAFLLSAALISGGLDLHDKRPITGVILIILGAGGVIKLGFDH